MLKLYIKMSVFYRVCKIIYNLYIKKKEKNVIILEYPIPN